MVFYQYSDTFSGKCFLILARTTVYFQIIVDIWEPWTIGGHGDQWGVCSFRSCYDYIVFLWSLWFIRCICDHKYTQEDAFMNQEKGGRKKRFKCTLNVLPMKEWHLDSRKRGHGR